MKYYLTLIFFFASTIAIAQVPILDSSTIKMPKSKALNKCIDENNKVMYTQFECHDTTKKADDQWIEQTNITYATATQKKVIKTKEQGKSLDPNQSGIDMLKDGMQDKSFMELFDQGLKALMMRQDMLKDL